MAQKRGSQLDLGDSFPEIDINTVQGTKIRLPDDVRGKWSVILIYRGDW